MTARFIVGDVLEVLPTLEEKSVDLVLTSPPFLALRSYLPADHPDKQKEGGSQPTPGAFIDWLVDVVEALDRVLAPHGSMVIELGDTYAGSGGAGGDYGEDGLRGGQPAFVGSGKLANYSDDRGNPAGMRDTTFSGANTKTGGGRGWPADKSLTLIPELFRMTLVYGFNPLTGRQTRRWRLRNVIRWVRPNPPVGALGDKFRPATSELMVFCRTDEAGRKRYFDLDAVREPYADSTVYRGDGGSSGLTDNGAGGVARRLPDRKMTQSGAPPLDWWNIPLLDGDEPTRMEPNLRPSGPGSTESGRPRGFKTHHTNTLGDYEANPLGAPPLDWWEIPPGGFSGAHYAVFPEALCVRPIKAMCPSRVCRRCGEPSKRIVDAHRLAVADNSTRLKNGAASNPRSGFSEDVPEVGWEYERNTLGFTDCEHHCPSCNGDQEEFCSTCNGTGSSYRPGLVLDPFAGSGTTLAVAVGHGRDALGIDLDERNLELARGRLGMFLEAAS